MTSVSSILRALLIAALVAVAAGCAGTRTQESTGEYIDDTVLTARVKAALLNDPSVSGLAINVETFKGYVQLSGFAKNEAERKRAHDLAHAVKGVSIVQNDILIK